MKQVPSIRLLYVWWVLVFVCTILLCLALSLLSLFSDALWLWTTAIILVVFSVLFVWYLPARYRSLRYEITSEYVLILGGVLNKTARYLYIKNIQFSAVERSLLDMMFHLHTVRLRSPGASLALYGLDDNALFCVTAVLPQLFDNNQ